MVNTIMKTKGILVIFTLMILAMFIVACTPQAPNVVPNETTNTTPVINTTPVETNTQVNILNGSATQEEIKSVVDANNQFAFDLYAKYARRDGNVFFSPYSISTALAMTYEGAKGQTASEMKTVFHFPDNIQSMRHAFASIYNSINAKDKTYTLKTANALWAQNNYVFQKEYFDVVDMYYGGKVTNLDFTGDAENSRITINNWVAGQTNDRIKDLMPPGTVNSDTRLVLTNAVYFNGTWANKFDSANTQTADFKVSYSKSVKPRTTNVNMMSLTGEKLYYAETDVYQAIEMPYEGNDLSMVIILPKTDYLSTVEQYLTTDYYSTILTSLQMQRVDVYMPKFKFDTKYMMAQDLAAMGMPTAFTPDADFSGMTGSKDLFISEVIHQAFVDVNEQGTEAAAATGVGVGTTSYDPTAPKVFKADHPFMFIIEHRATGEILFIGKVTDPSTMK
jgi:serpin B